MPLAALILVGCGGGSKGGNTVAVVNGDSISRDEFYKAMELKSDATVYVVPQQLQMQGSQIPPQAYTGRIANGNVGFDTLKGLVDQKITLQLAADQGLTPTKADIDAEIDRQRKENPEVLKQLTSNGYSLDYIRKNVEVALAQEKLVTKGITITPADVDDYIKRNPEDPLYYTSEGILLMYIVAQDAKARDTIDKELATGKQFSLVAAQYTADRSSAVRNYHLYGNGVEPFPMSQVEPKVAAIVKKMSEGQQSAWYPQGQGFVKFYLERRTPASKKTVDASIREKIRRALALAEGAKAIDINKQKIEKLKDAKVTINEDALKVYWDQYMKELKAAAAPSAITAPGSTASPAPTK